MKRLYGVLTAPFVVHICLRNLYLSVTFAFGDKGCEGGEEGGGWTMYDVKKEEVKEEVWRRRVDYMDDVDDVG